MNQRSFFLFIVVLLCSNIISGQYEIKPEIINYPKNIYNAEGQNWSVTQDENNVLYFGNNKGLLVFNGEEWKTYSLPKQQIVRGVSADGRGKIYTGGFGEVGYWQKNLYGGYHYHSLDNLITDTLFPNEEIWKIIATPDEALFQSFSRLYLLRNNRIKTIVPPGVVMFPFRVRDRFYVNVLNKGIFTIDENGDFVAVSSDSAVNSVYFILPYGSNEMLVGTEKNGIFIFDGKNYRPFPCADDAYLKTNEINNGTWINDNLLAIGTISGGLLLMDAQGKTVGKIDRNSGLENNTVLNIFKDADGNCWLALDKGIAQIVLNSNISYFRDLQGKVGTVYSIAIFQNYLYAATNHGLFRAPFTSLEAFDENALTRFGGMTGQVWDLKVIDHQLFCGNNKSTVLINRNNVRTLFDSSAGWDIEPLKNNPGILLEGTYNGVAVYKKTGGQWMFSNIISGTDNMPVNKLRIDKSGLIWIKHAYKGVFVFQPSKDFTGIVAIKELDKASGAPRDNNFSFYENEKNGNVLANSEAGIFDYDFSTNTLHRLDSLKKDLGEYFYSRTIIPDSGKGFWFINNDDGVVYKDNQAPNAVSFTFNSKIFALVSGFENIIPYSSSQSFICGEEGFAVINRNRYRSSAASIPTIMEIDIFDKGHYHVIDSSYFDGTDKIVLPYKQNGLIIHFSSLNYAANVSYSYSLSKDDNAVWSEWTHTSFKDFPNLSPGNYTFRLKTNLSDDTITFFIVINSPWYWSVWSKIMYVLLFALIILLAVRWHRHRLAKQQLLLTKRMKEEVALQRQKSENEILRLKEAQLSEEVVHKSEDLAKLAMDLIKKKNVLKKFKDNLDSLKKFSSTDEIHSQIQRLSKSLDKHVKDEETEWHLFDNGFNKVHEEFFDKLLQTYPELTAQDLRLAAYLKMNLSTKEIAPLLNISTRGVEIKRYRLRKKIQLEEHENLNDFMIKFMNM
ncbi:hypothetical protein A9P82_13150 [Arachidicoccus ginsenosidimutans]|uniref:hypothetical protein n=1 Tax=Arachidicoccus sp. BS20 TaxID=1850526 RepID=UPI0007F0C933|nr:hypothetical protein [Arachidicoccus sp. BS20]ANI90149.1 hypothetical protein A9P82_13150 [Arachidicoccus sp. BS20]